MPKPVQAVRVLQDPIRDWAAATHELDARFIAAVCGRNVNAAISCFLNSPDLIVVLWGHELHGPDQLRTAITRLFNEYDEVKVEIDRVTEIPSGDAVLAFGQATYRLTKSGAVTTMTEIWTDVRQRVNGQWVVVLDHAEVLHAT